MNISQGFDVRPAGNGGFVVNAGVTMFGEKPNIVAAFTSSGDMLEWLAKQYEKPHASSDPAAQAVTEAYRNVDREQVAAIEPEWIKWSGGKCPVPKDTRLEVAFRNGDYTNEEAFARTFRLCHIGSDADIVAYRVIS